MRARPHPVGAPTSTGQKNLPAKSAAIRRNNTHDEKDTSSKYQNRKNRQVRQGPQEIFVRAEFNHGSTCKSGNAAVQMGSKSALAGDRTITRVVKLLQGMLDKSKAESDEERTLYGKYKCYCDTNEAAKKASIESLGQQIGSLSNAIDGLQAATGVLSSEVAKLQADMAANVKARNEAQSARDKANAAFLAMESDSKAAIKQMVDAIEVLSAVGADQTLTESAADHKQFISGYNSKSLMKLHGVVKQALLAASSVTGVKQTRIIESFLQAPFTGTYTAQAGEVVGILKDMRDTFKSNLATAQATEAAEAEAHARLMATMREHAAVPMRRSRNGDANVDTVEAYGGWQCHNDAAVQGLG